MPEPAVVDRARALKRHAKYTGMPLREFCVTVTKGEAYELLTWFRQTADPKQTDLVLLDQAIQEAVDADDPFLVLKDFTLLGLEILPREQLH